MICGVSQIREKAREQSKVLSAPLHLDHYFGTEECAGGRLVALLPASDTKEGLGEKGKCE